jgi:hypothetical protein
MSWLDKALFSGGSPSSLYFDYRTPLEKTEDRTQEADLVGYTSEMARSIIRAARENRVFMKTKEGQVGIANARVEYGDLICQLHGCSELIILREVQENLVMGDPHRRYHKLVGKVHLTGWRVSSTSPKEFPTDSSIGIFEIV